MTEPTAIYLHIPFCRHRCAYCDFNTYAGMESLIDPYMAALTAEVKSLRGNLAGEIVSIFFGGGTPSLIPVRLLDHLLNTIYKHFNVPDSVEITLEANPGTISLEYLSDLQTSGVNRLSMGMQSAAPSDLRILEREHDFFDVVNAVRWARKTGFDNINLDLIFGLPYQRLASWQKTMQHACGLSPEHLSVYNLILEHGTPMKSWVDRGLLRQPDDELAADMYEYAMSYLPGHGFEHYEISNWARRDPGGKLLSCRHNMQYWRNRSYLGFGAGAHGYAGGVRTTNVRAPRAYIERMTASEVRDYPRSPATVNASPISRRDEMDETMMMGLRLIQEGVSDDDFRSRFGMGIKEIYPEQTDSLVKNGLLIWDRDSLKLSPRGILLGNRVFMAFVG